jgi:hypothetical protein
MGPILNHRRSTRDFHATWVDVLDRIVIVIPPLVDDEPSVASNLTLEL